nr:ribonuclease H-like domain-containing protein [Tanacetum cinerariifolium]
MVTRSHVGTTLPNPRYAGHVSTISPLPQSYKEAFNYPNWRNAMFDAYNALIKNKTLTSVPRLEGANIVRCMWLFRHKFLAGGTLSQYKACLISNGSTQVEGVDVDETFSLCKYAMEILMRAHMVGCNPSRTPVDTESKLGDSSTLVCLYMHDTWEPHFSALKWILRYVQGTLDYGLQLFSSTTDSLIAYLDANWAGCLTTRWSTSGYCVFLGNNLLSWSFKRQPTLSPSTVEAENRGVSNAIAETCWIRNLLHELYTPLSSTTIVYCDNVSDVYLSSNPVQHQLTKHIEIDIHFVRDLVATGQSRILHVPSRF